MIEIIYFLAIVLIIIKVRQTMEFKRLTFLIIYRVGKRLIIKWMLFKPLYKLQKVIDPNAIFPIAKPKYRKYNNFVYKIFKMSMF